MLIFISKVQDLFGSDAYTDKELLDILTQNNAKSDEAITFLLEQQAAREAAAVAAATALLNAPPPPPGFGSSEKQKPPIAPVPKRPPTVGISSGKTGAKQSKIGGGGGGGGGNKSKFAGSTPPLTPKSRGGSRTSSPAIGFGSDTKVSPPLPLSRSNSKSGLASGSSSGQLNRMAPLSDDEYEYEDISSAAVARLTLVVAGHVDAVSAQERERERKKSALFVTRWRSYVGRWRDYCLQQGVAVCHCNT